ncbi:MAG: hypothetical protein [Bacteriophage sp.]|nr:MAG: hypothetical protein [Bacteriophage sp.]
MECKQSFFGISAKGAVHSGLAARISAADQHLLHLFYCISGISFLKIVPYAHCTSIADLSSISVNILPRLVVITPDADLSTCLISRFSSCRGSFFIDTCMHQLPISAIEGCMTVAKENISSLHSASG